MNHVQFTSCNVYAVICQRPSWIGGDAMLRRYVTSSHAFYVNVILTRYEHSNVYKGRFVQIEKVNICKYFINFLSSSYFITVNTSNPLQIGMYLPTFFKSRIITLKTQVLNLSSFKYHNTILQVTSDMSGTFFHFLTIKKLSFPFHTTHFNAYRIKTF